MLNDAETQHKTEEEALDSLLATLNVAQIAALMTGSEAIVAAATGVREATDKFHREVKREVFINEPYALMLVLGACAAIVSHDAVSHDATNTGARRATEQAVIFGLRATHAMLLNGGIEAMRKSMEEKRNLSESEQDICHRAVMYAVHADNEHKHLPELEQFEASQPHFSAKRQSFN